MLSDRIPILPDDAGAVAQRRAALEAIEPILDAIDHAIDGLIYGEELLEKLEDLTGGKITRLGGQL